MDDMTKHDPDAGFEPAFAAPPNACDAHFHVFGRPSVTPTAPTSATSRLTSRWRPISNWRAVSASCATSSCSRAPTVSTIPACSTPCASSIRRSGAASSISTKTSTSDKELAELNALGVRGIRVNISPIRKPEAGLAASMLPRIARLAKICRELGWHLDFLTPGWLVSELMPTLRELPVEFSVAHMGLFPAKDGPEQAGFQEFLKLVGDGSKRCWVKLTGIYRFSTAPDFADVKPIAQALMEAVPDQLIWGSDFPHLSFHDRVGTIQLYNLLGEWAPDAGCASASSPTIRPGCSDSNKLQSGRQHCGSATAEET